nr:acyl-CoA dehydrogenase family protein [Rhodococcus sp. (in: high G+C Gram-positive bacteria)]
MTVADVVAPSSSPTDERERLVAAARDLGPLLAKNARYAETGRRVPQDSVDAIRAAGLFDLTKPARFGGSEEGFRTFVETTLEIGRFCGSTAWVVALSNVTSYMIGMSPESVQEEILGTDPHVVTCGVITPTATTVRVDGGYRVTGRWGFASASLHASWAVMGIPLTDEEGDVIGAGMGWIPMADVTIDDTWYVAGMAGSGSNTVVADDIFVPDIRVLSVADIMSGNSALPFPDESLYHSSLVPALLLALVGPMLGMAEGAYDSVMATLKKGKPISYSFYDKAVDSPTTQLGMAKARSLIDQARLLALRAADDVDSAASTGRLMSVLERSRVRMDSAHAAQRCREAVETLLDIGGAGSFAQVNPLQRIWRDLETSSRHAFINVNINQEVYGRALLGIEEQVTPFV